VNPGDGLFSPSRSSDATLLFVAGFHCFETRVRQGIGSFELLFD
jgi:hypothetical protein